MAFPKSTNTEFRPPRLPFERRAEQFERDQLFYASMGNGSTAKLPLRDAYAFGIEKGLDSDIEQIRQMPIKWPPDTLQYETSLRCAYVIELFEKNGIFEEFKAKYWPNGNTADGERRRRHYLTIKQRYEAYSANPGKQTVLPTAPGDGPGVFDWVGDAISDLGEPSTWDSGVQNWMNDISHTLSRVKAADREERKSREFQQMLWEGNGVAAVGQGNIPVQAALDDAGFREWFSERSFEPLPEQSGERITFLAKLYEELKSRLQAFVPDRIPHLKIFRVLGSLYPECMTTIADRGKVLTLADRLKIGRENGPVGCHVLIRERLDPILDAEMSEPLTLESRMVVPWLLYERYCEAREKVTEEPAVNPREKVRLRPLPAVQRLRSLHSLPEGFPGMLAILDFIGDGVGRDDLMAFLPTVAPEYKPESLPTIANSLQSQFNVIRRERDRYVRTERGENLVASRDPSQLGDWLLTQIFGVDHVIAALRDRGPMTTAELVALLRGANPGWQTDIVPRVLLGWLRSLRAIEPDSAKRLKLAEVGQQWAGWIDWVPEAFSPGPSLDALFEEPTSEAPAALTLQLPAASQIVEAVQKKGRFEAARIAALHAGLWANDQRHFAILTGVSGSGKTLLAREYAAALTSEAAAQSVITVAVEPGWYDPGPLLGYPNPIHPDEYVRRPFLDFLMKAADNPTHPYVVILDEMNLSHPEQYMAPLLSAMETGDPIPLHSKEDLFDGVRRAIRYPRNLVLIGTVNMDETTHGLSDKVLDRAFVLEFWDVDLRDYPWGQGRLQEPREERVRGLLEALMTALSPARLHFGWRVIDDIFSYLTMAESMDGMLGFDSALDTAICSKVLPKLRGEDSVRFRTALDGCHRAFTEFDLPRAKTKVEELQSDLKTMGSARYWR
jgi:5-methylcytosine-specific restriction protein B